MKRQPELEQTMQETRFGDITPGADQKADLLTGTKAVPMAQEVWRVQYEA